MASVSASLALRIVDGGLPWDRAIEIRIDAFLERFTLHDSTWLGLFLDCAYEDSAIAMISLDPVWNPSVSAPTSVCADWPLLFLRLKSVSAVHLSGFQNVGGIQRGIGDAKVEHLSSEEVRTVIRDHYGGSVSVQHLALVEALALSPDEKVLDLSGSRPR